MIRRFFGYNSSASPSGYIALLSVIVLGAIGTAVMLSIIFAGINATKTDISLEKGNQARFSASSCGEEALQKILETSTTSSSGSLTFGSSTCSYSIATSSGQTVLVNASGTSGTMTSKITITLSSISPAIVVTSWQDVGDF